MKTAILLIIILLFSSCNKEYSDYKRVGNKIIISPKNGHLEDIEVIKWYVGAAFKQKISKGITLEIKFPILKKEDFEDLISHSKANSWLVKIRRSSVMRTMEIGKIYVPLATFSKRAKKIVKSKQTEKGFVRIYYAAAAPSQRFENFQCPAFGHNKVINDTEIVTTTNKLSKIIAGPIVSRHIGGKVHEFSLRPVVLNGGTSLKGEYSIEIALYNYESKMRRSNYLKLPEKAVVLGESTKNLGGCKNFVIPPRNENKKGKFNWNR